MNPQSIIPNNSATPMLRQYLTIKAGHPDSILMFRLGDFYEMFFEDAVEASKILDITLTSRNRNDPNPVPLCGVPYHSVEPYITRLLENGKKVAICDQIEDPKTAKGVVKREVTRVITPGVVVDGLGLVASRPNILACAYPKGGEIGVAIADASTGFFEAGVVASESRLIEELNRVEAREVILPSAFVHGGDGLSKKLKEAMQTTLITPLDPQKFETQTIESLEGAGEIIALSPKAGRAAAGLLGYLTETQRGNIRHMKVIRPYAGDGVMRLDEATKRNLELLETMRERDKKGSLIDAIDRTATALGARKLRHWLLNPLTNPTEINLRLDAVESLVTDPKLMRDLMEVLPHILDIERITSRAATGLANARDIVGLGRSLLGLAKLKECLGGAEGKLAQIAGSIDPHPQLSHAIEQRIVDDPPLSLREGGLIRPGVSSELDEMRDIITNAKEFISGLEARERKATGITSLKIRYNKVFGYYLEVTHTHREKTPPHYIRKQTLANAERFITPELKEYEEKILGAQEKTRQLEYNIFQELREEVALASDSLFKTAEAIATLDAITSHARVASEYDYRRPTVDDSLTIDIREGRHPIVERIGGGSRFVPNDVFLDDSDNRILMITGPNMAGKSTVMRQTALIVLMAQIGSFVPASSATIGIVDRIFTRVGASDALAQGQSTFMVEMAEAALILKEAGPKGLVVIDEIGRGTSTFDGLAIAWAVAEDLHDRVRARTMFATHYHELTELALTKPGIKNMHIAVREWNGEVIFLRRLLPGATSRSYGIQVARLAGLPQGVITRAGEVLANLESGELDEAGKPRIGLHTDATQDMTPVQYQLFQKPPSSDIARDLARIDIQSITPLEALNILHELKGKL